MTDLRPRYCHIKGQGVTGVMRDDGTADER
jgi:hypothetical protein